MRHLLETYMDIALLRARPQQLPVSRVLFAVALLLHLMLGTALRLFDEGFVLAFATAAALTLLLAAVVHSLAVVRHRRARFRQTVSALAGFDVIVALLALPLRVWAKFAPDGSSILLFLGLLMIVWSVAVTAHIFRYALDLTSGRAVLVTFGYMVLSYAIAGLMLPPIE